MQAKADLHIHTTASDGALPPEEIIKKAKASGLKAVAITDHDTYNGYRPAAAAGAESGIEVITGIEITSDYNGRESHILGYGFDPGFTPLIAFVKNQKLRRHKRADRMIRNLNRLGFEISMDEVTAEAGTLNISRNHIAGVLVSKGYAAHPRVVFQKWLGNHGTAYYKSEYEDYKSVIRLIHQAGGVAILAHPGLYYVDDDIENYIRAGIDGFECIHPSHNYMFQKKFLELCSSRGLVPSGGSDFHGKSQEDESHFGTVAIDMEWVEAILERARLIKSQHFSD